jgi:hypothetical protein
LSSPAEYENEHKVPSGFAQGKLSTPLGLGFTPLGMTGFGTAIPRGKVWGENPVKPPKNRIFGLSVWIPGKYIVAKRVRITPHKLLFWKQGEKKQVTGPRDRGQVIGSCQLAAGDF